MKWVSSLAALLLLLGSSLAVAAQDGPAAGLAEAIEKARGEQVDVLAPKNFAAAVKAQENAARDAARGRSPERISQRLEEGEAALKRAAQSAAEARKSLASVVRARADAVTANAARLAPEVWPKAAERFAQAMMENEAGDMDDAQERAAEATVLLRDAELRAIKAGILNEARSLIARAQEADVERFAPRSLQAARRYLADAEQQIQRNRYDTDAPRRAAAQASYEARHASYLAQLIERVLEQEDDDEAGVEALILAWEEPLQRIAADVELSPRFDEGMQPVMQELGEQVRQQSQEMRRLKQELGDRNEQIAAMNTQLEHLEARLGGVSQERIALQRRVDAQERMRLNVATIQASFAAQEARVYRRGDDVVMSLLGIGFPSGRSTIDSGNAAFMRKVQQALALFPEASVSVEGHTDSNGSESKNLILSQDRADAVKQYLVSNFALNAEKISSIGYGEARPVATNETAVGRARNRRIDLIVHPEMMGSGSWK